MKITVLGVAGGRFVVINQLRASGGWVLEMDGELIHVDPGPGALVRARQYGVKLARLTGVIVSHVHPDHYSDSEMVIEAMTSGAKVKRGFIIGDETVFRGGEGFRTVISGYHANAAEKSYIMKPGDRIRPGKGRIEIEAVPTRHGEPNCLGFVFRGSNSLGFTGDGEYYKGQSGHFKGCDYLLINCLRPREIEWPLHMNAEGARKLVGEVKPRLAILQHFGMKMLKGIAEREARWITRQTGIETIAARDGQVLELNGEAGNQQGKRKALGLKKFLK